MIKEKNKFEKLCDDVDKNLPYIATIILAISVCCVFIGIWISGASFTFKFLITGLLSFGLSMFLFHLWDNSK